MPVGLLCHTYDGFNEEEDVKYQTHSLVVFTGFKIPPNEEEHFSSKIPNLTIELYKKQEQGILQRLNQYIITSNQETHSIHD